mmetsp:Transcript_12066/g.31919  ORF Transcript_12066/g.31919 Transcript_12066/m.31919 type:complete len:239 (+) Transcript_12066:1282-1998(+)
MASDAPTAPPTTDIILSDPPPPSPPAGEEGVGDEAPVDGLPPGLMMETFTFVMRFTEITGIPSDLRLPTNEPSFTFDSRDSAAALASCWLSNPFTRKLMSSALLLPVGEVCCNRRRPLAVGTSFTVRISTSVADTDSPSVSETPRWNFCCAAASNDALFKPTSCTDVSTDLFSAEKGGDAVVVTLTADAVVVVVVVVVGTAGVVGARVVVSAAVDGIGAGAGALVVVVVVAQACALHD